MTSAAPDGPYSMWGRMQLMTSVRNAPRDVLSPTEKLVLQMLLTRLNAAGEAWPSLDTLADDCSASRGTVRATVRTLQERGLLFIRCRRIGDDGVEVTGDYVPLPKGAKAPPKEHRDTSYLYSVPFVVTKHGYALANWERHEATEPTRSPNNSSRNVTPIESSDVTPAAKTAESLEVGVEEGSKLLRSSEASASFASADVGVQPVHPRVQPLTSSRVQPLHPEGATIDPEARHRSEPSRTEPGEASHARPSGSKVESREQANDPPSMTEGEWRDRIAAAQRRIAMLDEQWRREEQEAATTVGEELDEVVEPPASEPRLAKAKTAVEEVRRAS